MSSNFFLLMVTQFKTNSLSSFVLFFFLFFKCNSEMNGSFVYSATVLFNELSFHVVGIVIQRQGCLMLQKKCEDKVPNLYTGP